jgi:uncharacterized protein YukE
VSGAIVMPGGDPAALEQMAARLETAAQGAGTLADSTGQVTADVRSAAQWTGDAADGYAAFTKNLGTGVNGTGAPLAQIAAAVREYAGSLRTAQQKVAAYATAVQSVQAARNSPASVASAELAGQDAATALAAQQAAGDQAAATVRTASKELADPFGPDGAVRAWIERVETPWDLSAGDAVLGRYLAAAAGAARTWNWLRSSPKTCRSSCRESSASSPGRGCRRSVRGRRAKPNWPARCGSSPATTRRPAR